MATSKKKIVEEIEEEIAVAVPPKPEIALVEFADIATLKDKLNEIILKINR